MANQKKSSIWSFQKGLCHLKWKARYIPRLLHAIYGLKQAGLAWWCALDKSMQELGFKQLKSDASPFVYKWGKDIVLAIIYVNDTLFCRPSKSLVDKIKATFMKKWECRDLREPSEFLWMNIHQDGHCILINQRNYVNKVLEHCGMINAKPAHTPLPQGYYPEKNDAPVNPELCIHFQTITSLLLYLMIGTHPDISYVVTQLAHQFANPSKEYLEKALYICWYLLSISDHSLWQYSTITVPTLPGPEPGSTFLEPDLEVLVPFQTQNHWHYSGTTSGTFPHCSKLRSTASTGSVLTSLLKLLISSLNPLLFFIQVHHHINIAGNIICMSVPPPIVYILSLQLQTPQSSSSILGSGWGEFSFHLVLSLTDVL